MRLSNNKGFTLAEAFFAAVIVGIGLLAVIAAIYSQTTFLNKNREQTIATLTAQGEIEFLRGQPFDSIVTRPFYEEEAPGLAYLHYGQGNGKGDIQIDGAGFTGDSNVKKVSVTVTWDSINQKTLQKTMATFITRLGIDKQ